MNFLLAVPMRLPTTMPGTPDNPLPRVDEVLSRFQSTTRIFPARTLMIILLVMVGILFVVWMLQWYRNRPKDPTPNHLFRQMAKKLHLGLMDQWLLIRIAHQQELPSPLTLLLSRGTLLHHGQAYAQQLLSLHSSLAHSRVQRIVRDLFGSELHARQDTLTALGETQFNISLIVHGQDAGPSQ